MNLCKSCGMLQKDCQCRRNKQEEEKPTESNCSQCNVIHKTQYLRASPVGLICSSCMTINTIEPSDREYLRGLANEHNVKLHDMPVHLEAANHLNKPIEEYLSSLPRSRIGFCEAWKDIDIKVGNIKL